jgi:hypothetical protein
LGAGSLFFISPADFLWLSWLLSGSWVGSGLPLASSSLGGLAPTPMEGSFVDSSPGGRAKTGMTGIGMSPSKLGMGEMKLSKSRVQTNMM